MTTNDIETILEQLCRYGPMPRWMLQKLPPWRFKTGRTLRRNLARLADDGVIERLRPALVLPAGGKPFPMWGVTDAGRNLLAVHYDDRRYLARPQLPPRHLVEHYLGIISTHVDFALALAAQETYRLLAWLNEWDTITPQSRDGQPRRLFTEFSRKPRRVCAPDYAFLLQLRTPDGAERTKCFLGEHDRHTTQSAKRIALDKAPGYELLRRGGHRLFWPEHAVTEDNFTVIVVTTGSQAWRDALRKAFAAAPCPELYRFACREDLTAETLLFKPVFYRIGDDEPKPLLHSAQQEAAHV